MGGDDRPDDGETETAARLSARAGVAALEWLEELIQPNRVGLPSQQAPTSRRLAATHAWLTDASTAVTDSATPEASTALQLDGQLYAAAYDDDTAGRYDQAKHRGQTARQIVRTALLLSGELEDHPLFDSLDDLGDASSRPGFFGRRRNRRERPSLDEWTTPVEVPAPEKALTRRFTAPSPAEAGEGTR